MAVDTMSLTGFQCKASRSSECIDAMGHGLKVRWSNAVADSTEMIKSKAFGNLAFGEFIARTMGSLLACGMYVKIAVPILVYKCCPEPAGSKLRIVGWYRAVFINLRSQAVSRALTNACASSVDNIRVAVPQKTGVVFFAQPPSIGTPLAVVHDTKPSTQFLPGRLSHNLASSRNRLYCNIGTAI